MSFAIVLGTTILGELLLAGLLSLLRRAPGRLGRLHEALCQAPGLDVVVFLMTLAPPIAAALLAGWVGLGAAILGQVLSLHVWVELHELAHPGAARAPRMLRIQNRLLGRTANHVALWLSVVVLPVFWAIRLGELLVWPPLRACARFPRYRQGDWVNVSRHKYDALVGHDLIWCLYCDWMTGVYSLAGEMLRNVESFWCPIRFLDAAKCANCRVDFPDVDEWVEPTETLEPAITLMERKYGGGRHEWFGHPARLTVEGRAPDAAAEDPERTG